MHLIQVRFAFELLADPLLLRMQDRYQREDDRESHSASFLGQDELRYDAPVLLDFLPVIDRFYPAGWSVAARDQTSGSEWSFGHWWPLALRPHERRLPGTRSTTVHLFAGAREGGTARMIIRWQEQGGAKVKWTFPDRTIDEVLLSREQVHEGRLDNEIQVRLHQLISRPF